MSILLPSPTVVCISRNYSSQSLLPYAFWVGLANGRSWQETRMLEQWSQSLSFLFASFYLSLPIFRGATGNGCSSSVVLAPRPSTMVQRTSNFRIWKHHFCPLPLTRCGEQCAILVLWIASPWPARPLSSFIPCVTKGFVKFPLLKSLDCFLAGFWLIQNLCQIQNEITLQLLFLIMIIFK